MTTTTSISVPEFFTRNRRYFAETKECALIQVRKSVDEPWMDYGRSRIEEAEHHLRTKRRHGDGDLWRVVDWIDKDQIDFHKDLPATTTPYTAINGHRMVAPVTGWDYYLAHEDEQGPRPKSTSWNARCTDDCRACGGGEVLPDW